MKKMPSIHDEHELSYVSFLETFASVKSSDHDACQENRSEPETTSRSEEESTLSLPMSAIEVERGNFEERASSDGRLSVGDIHGRDENGSCSKESAKLKRSKLRRISIDRLTSLGDAMQGIVSSRKVKSSRATEQGGVQGLKRERRMSAWFPGFPSYVGKKLGPDSESISTDDDGESSGSVSSKSSFSISKPAVFPIPAARHGAAAHRGYLDCRNKKKKWERFWCVLEDACLYCYNTPQSDVTRDAVLLRGYNVVADVTNLNRSKFMIRLEQQGVRTLHFACDNHRDFLLWVGTLEKETRLVASHRQSESQDDTTFPKQPIPRKGRTPRYSLPDLAGSHLQQTTTIQRTVSQERLDHEVVRMQKHKLLKELSVQRKQLMEEQRMLDKVDKSSDLSASDACCDAHPTPSRRESREEVTEHYERVKTEEELKTTKYLTFLNRRRNSAQIKADRITKDLAPKSGRHRRDNHFQFSAMEARLKELQETLALVDRELEEEEANKLHNMEKIERKRDLELLILEQRETLAILRRHQSRGMSHCRRHSGTSAEVTSPSSGRSNNTLGSIDEMSTTSDDRVSSATNSTGSASEAYPPVPPVRMRNRSGVAQSSAHNSGSADDVRTSPLFQRSSSEPTKRTCSIDENASSDTDSGFQVSQVTVDSTSSSPNSPFVTERQAASSTRNTGHGKVQSRASDSSTHYNIDADGLSALSDQTSNNLVFSDVKPSRNKTAADGAKEKIENSVLAQIEDFELFAKNLLEKQSAKS